MYAMVGYFDELSPAVAAHDVGPDERSAIAEGYAMEVIGPVPEEYA